MKRNKRYAKKQTKSLINKKVLARIIKQSNICQHAIKELKLAGYGNGKGGPNDWMYQQVLEAVAVFASHGNSGSSAPWEINLVQKLCNWDIISPLTFKDDEWNYVKLDGSYQNKRKSSIFKEPDGSIYNIYTFSKRPTSTYHFNTKTWEKNNKDITWSGGLFEHKDNILTGRYFSRCRIRLIDIDKSYTPRPKQIIDCVEVEISPDNWIMSVDANNIDLAILNTYYHIDWKECSCLKGVKLEDVTPELEQKAFEEMK